MNVIHPRTLAVREQPLPEAVIQCPHCQGDITRSIAQQRTVLTYFTKPLVDQIARAFRGT